MIDFIDKINNPDKYLPKPISARKQELKVGDKVRCYEEDNDDMNNFIGYAYITEILDADANFCWCEATRKEFENGFDINYSYYVIKC